MMIIFVVSSLFLLTVSTNVRTRLAFTITDSDKPVTVVSNSWDQTIESIRAVCGNQKVRVITTTDGSSCCRFGWANHAFDNVTYNFSTSCTDSPRGIYLADAIMENGRCYVSSFLLGDWQTHREHNDFVKLKALMLLMSTSIIATANGNQFAFLSAVEKTLDAKFIQMNIEEGTSVRSQDLPSPNMFVFWRSFDDLSEFIGPRDYPQILSSAGLGDSFFSSLYYSKEVTQTKWYLGNYTNSKTFARISKTRQITTPLYQDFFRHVLALEDHDQGLEIDTLNLLVQEVIPWMNQLNEQDVLNAPHLWQYIGWQRCHQMAPGMVTRLMESSDELRQLRQFMSDLDYNETARAALIESTRAALWSVIDPNVSCSHHKWLTWAKHECTNAFAAVFQELFTSNVDTIKDERTQLERTGRLDAEERERQAVHREQQERAGRLQERAQKEQERAGRLEAEDRALKAEDKVDKMEKQREQEEFVRFWTDPRMALGAGIVGLFFLLGFGLCCRLTTGPCCKSLAKHCCRCLKRDAGAPQTAVLHITQSVTPEEDKHVEQEPGLVKNLVVNIDE